MMMSAQLGCTLWVCLCSLTDQWLVVITLRRWGYAFDNTLYMFAPWFIGVRLLLFPAFKVQQMPIYPSIMMKKTPICASIKYVACSGSITLLHVPESIA